MGKKIKTIIGACVWAVIGVITAAAIIPSCSEKEPIADTTVPFKLTHTK